MKTLLIILLVSNLATGWLYWESVSSSETTNDRVGKALLPFYLLQSAQSVDVHKLLDREKVPYNRKGDVLNVGYLQIEFGDHGVAKDVQITSK
jgi:hypothetical protein